MRHHILLGRSKGIQKKHIAYATFNLHSHLHSHNPHHMHGGAAVRKDYENESHLVKHSKVKHIRPLRFRV